MSEVCNRKEPEHHKETESEEDASDANERTAEEIKELEAAAHKVVSKSEKDSRPGSSSSGNLHLWKATSVTEGVGRLLALSTSFPGSSRQGCELRATREWYVVMAPRPPEQPEAAKSPSFRTFSCWLRIRTAPASAGPTAQTGIGKTTILSGWGSRASQSWQIAFPADIHSHPCLMTWGSDLSGRGAACFPGPSRIQRSWFSAK